MNRTQHAVKQAHEAVRDARRKLSAALIGAAGSREAYNLAWTVYEKLLPAWEYLDQHCDKHGSLLEAENMVCPTCDDHARELDYLSHRERLALRCKKCDGSGHVLYALPQENGSGEWLIEGKCPDCQR